jgi:hypothetical protein
LGREARGASVSSPEEGESAGESREKSSIEVGSEGDGLEVELGERRSCCWRGSWFVGVMVVLVLLSWVVVLIECSVGKLGVDFE